MTMMTTKNLALKELSGPRCQDKAFKFSQNNRSSSECKNQYIYFDLVATISLCEYPNAIGKIYEVVWLVSYSSVTFFVYNPIIIT